MFTLSIEFKILLKEPELARSYLQTVNKKVSSTLGYVVLQNIILI